MTVLSYRQALHDTLRAELQRDEDVFLIGEEIGVFEGSYKITAGLLAEFGPRRVRDTPICEEGFTGVAIGAAMMGLRPVVEIMTINFSLLAIDQIVNNAAKLRSLSGGQVSVPLVIRTPGGGGQQLSATHSQNLEVWYAHVPGLKVVAPATPADAKGLLAAAIRDDDPVLVLENLALYNTKGEVPDGDRDRQGRHGHGGLRRGRAHPHPGPGGGIGPDRHPHRRHRPGRRRCRAAGSCPRSGRTSGDSSPAPHPHPHRPPGRRPRCRCRRPRWPASSPASAGST